jgi:hypothetical protein
MRARRAGPAVLALLCVAGCGASPREQLDAALEPVLSWLATARTLIDHWSAGRVSTRFARTTLQASQQSLERERARLASSPSSLSDGNVAATVRLLTEATVATSRIWAALGGPEPPRLDREADELAEIEQKLRALQTRRGSSP